MIKVSESVLKEARALASQMLISGETICVIRSSSGAELACVSPDSSKLVGVFWFQEGGTTFYLGQRLPT